MIGTAWILIDLLPPVVALLVLVALIATAKPGPERVPYSKPEPAKSDKDARTRRRQRRTRIDGTD